MFRFPTFTRFCGLSSLRLVSKLGLRFSGLSSSGCFRAALARMRRQAGSLGSKSQSVANFLLIIRRWLGCSGSLSIPARTNGGTLPGRTEDPFPREQKPFRSESGISPRKHLSALGVYRVPKMLGWRGDIADGGRKGFCGRGEGDGVRRGKGRSEVGPGEGGERLRRCFIFPFGIRFSIAAILASAALDASAVNVYCRVLRSARSDATIYSVVWYTAREDGTMPNDYELFPQLVGMHRTTAGDHFVYYPDGYSDSNAPFLLASVQSTQRGFSVSADDADKVPDLIEQLNSSPASARAAITGVSFDSSSGAINITTSKPGTIVGNGVVTYDASGNIVVGYPDSTGYIPGYTPNIEGGYSPCYYDPSQVSGGRAIPLSSAPTPMLQNLSYDATTDQYSYESPDYRAALAALQEQLQGIRSDMHDIEIPAPEIPAPEVTYNPTVVVPAPVVSVNPEISVNPPEVNVTVTPPEVTVNPPVVNVAAPVVNVAAPVVNVPPYNGPSSNQFEAASSGTEIDTSLPDFTSDEQDIITVYQGWDTGFPFLESSANMGLDLLLGPIPQIGQALSVPSIEVSGYPINIDFTAYSTFISYFRAACLFILLFVFGYALWNTIVQSLQI